MRAAWAATAPSDSNARMMQGAKRKGLEIRSTQITFRIGAAGEAAARATLNPASV